MAGSGRMFGAGRVETFLGLPACGDLDLRGARLALIGADGCTPRPSAGFPCAGGPTAIRAAGAAHAAHLAHVNFDLGGPVLPEGPRAVDCGDLSVRLDDPEGNRDLIRAALGTILDQEAVPLLLGGDASLAAPLLQAFGDAGRQVVILQIGAGIGWGGIGWGGIGTPPAWDADSILRRASEMVHVTGIVQVGQRGLGPTLPAELRDARDRGAHLVPAGEVARAGVWRAVDLIPEGTEIIVCLDLDALDPSAMPAVPGRMAGGLDYWHVLELVGAVVEKTRITALVMAGFTPDRDIDGQGATVAAQLLAGVMGILARQG